MTYKDLKDIVEKNKIPEDAAICSNSGWECGATEIGAVYYSPSKNEIHLVASISNGEYVEDQLMEDEKRVHDWILLL